MAKTHRTNVTETPDAGMPDRLPDDWRVSADTLALLMRDPKGAHKYALGRVTMTGKRVRSIARDILPRIIEAREQDGRTSHAYTEQEADALVARIASGGGEGATQGADAVRAALKGGAK